MDCIEAGTIKRIHVNQHHIRDNRKDGKLRPIFTIKTSKRNVTANWFQVDGELRGVYSSFCGEKKLSCGAEVWLETTAKVFFR